MTPGEHLLVLFSIVLGLGLTELLSSLHDLLHPETGTKWHWLPAYWACSVFVSIVFWWWGMYGLTEVELPSFFGVIVILMAPVLLYLMATSVLPDIAPGDTVDLGSFYMANRRRFFGFAAAYTGVLWVHLWFIGGNVSRGNHAWAAVALIAMVILARSSNLRVHAAFTILNALMTGAGIAAYWSRIG